MMMVGEDSQPTTLYQDQTGSYKHSDTWEFSEQTRCKEMITPSYLLTNLGYTKTKIPLRKSFTILLIKALY